MWRGTAVNRRLVQFLMCGSLSTNALSRATHCSDDDVKPGHISEEKSSLSSLQPAVRSGASSGQGVLVVPAKPLNFTLIAVGTYGDIQPFIAIGQELASDGHRVRVATHAILRTVVENKGLEFYPLGGDPIKLAEFAVKNKGVFPKGLKEVQGLRGEIKAYVEGQLGACIAPDPNTPERAFKADVVVANPITYAAVHCADALGLPLHLVFTQPWTPTREFAHPQARFMHEKKGHSRLPSKVMAAANRQSYVAIDGAMFTVTADILSAFRQKILQAGSIYSLRGYHAPLRQKAAEGRDTIPFTYVWSPSLLPKPSDWPDHINVVGFAQVRDSHAEAMAAVPDDLIRFLRAGPPPVYVGFGSMILPPSRARELTQLIVEAVEETGFRCILAAGTVAAGLKAGRPTFVVPFFGDQSFWGAICAQRKVGPPPVPVEALKKEHLVAAISFMETHQVKRQAVKLGEQIALEPDGAQAAVASIYRSLPDRVKQPAKAQTALHFIKPPNTDSSPNAAVAGNNSARARVTEISEGDGPTCTGRGMRLPQDHGDALESCACAPVANSDSAAAETSKSHYFDKKKAPLLTWWWELGSAYASVLLLPVIALLPGNTALVEDQ